MNKGKRLQKGDTIGIVAPAGYSAADKINAALLNLHTLGYNVKVGEGARRRWHGYAGTDTERAREINDFFRDDEVAAILCLRGGYGSIRLLQNVDYRTVRCNPKIFMGYSDITALHLAINQLSELITFHGPMLASNFVEMDHETLASFERTLTGGDLPEIRNPEDSPLMTLIPGSAEGILIGGNLTTFVSLIGTPYAPDFNNKILFIEEIGEAAYRIDRMLSQLKLAGLFKNVQGIILGDFNDCGPSSPHDMTLPEVFQDRLGDLGIPIIYNFKSGHCSPMMTLPFGAKAKINGDNATIQILERVVD
ncbi:MAG TPA: LD-carboxypeptidase [Bacillota bacterium]|nr:LD-carboxypeptidase [Bacillota bacterium]